MRTTIFISEIETGGSFSSQDQGRDVSLACFFIFCLFCQKLVCLSFNFARSEGFKALMFLQPIFIFFFYYFLHKLVSVSLSFLQF